jgi:hypothetical protein
VPFSGYFASNFAGAAHSDARQPRRKCGALSCEICAVQCHGNGAG